MTMNKLFSRFVKNESGATAIEYGLIAGLISVAIIAGITLIGLTRGDGFDCFTHPGRITGPEQTEAADVA